MNDHQLTNLLASDATKRLPSPSCETSDIQRKLAEAEAKLEPAPNATIVAELAACLTLVGAGSMSQGDRAEWIKVAKVTIGDIPAGPFQTGCAAARRKCRFANELVPTILEESAQWAGWLRSAARRARAEWENPPVAFLPSPPEDRPLTVDEVLKMAPEIVALGRKNRAIDADVLEQFDCIIAERHRLDAIVAARKAASG